MRIVKPVVFKNYGFSRESIATYYDENGLLTIAQTNELRMGHSPSGAFIGTIIEDEGVNRHAKSEDFEGRTGIYSQIDSIDDDSIIGPTGDQDATKVVQNIFEEDYGYGLAGQAKGIVFNLSSATHMTARDCFTFFIKPISQCKRIVLSLHKYGPGPFGGAFGMKTIDIIFDDYWTGYQFKLADNQISHPGEFFILETLKNGWYRVGGRLSFPDQTPTSELDWQLCISAYPWDGQSGEIEYGIFGAQAEDEQISSYIPNHNATAVATRARDIQSGLPAVIYTNVEEDDFPVYDPLVPYTIGTQVIIKQPYHRIYKLAAETSQGDYPPDNPDIWVDAGATNAWRMFDPTVGPEFQTVSSENTLSVIMGFEHGANTLAMLNVYALRYKVVMRNDKQEIVYEREEDLMTTARDIGWYNYFFAERQFKKMVLLMDLPTYAPSTIELTLFNSDAPRLGKLIVGAGLDIGPALYGSSVGIIDYSIKQKDDFGYSRIVERRFVDRADFDVAIRNYKIDDVRDYLADVRATPALYIGVEEYRSTVIYGFYNRFNIVISGPTVSDCSIQVEGI